MDVKDKIVNEYFTLIDNLEKGKLYNYSHIIDLLDIINPILNKIIYNFSEIFIYKSGKTKYTLLLSTNKTIANEGEFINFKGKYSGNNIVKLLGLYIKGDRFPIKTYKNTNYFSDYIKVFSENDYYIKAFFNDGTMSESDTINIKMTPPATYYYVGVGDNYEDIIDDFHKLNIESGIYKSYDLTVNSPSLKVMFIIPSYKTLSRIYLDHVRWNVLNLTKDTITIDGIFYDVYYDSGYNPGVYNFTLVE